MRYLRPILTIACICSFAGCLAIKTPICPQVPRALPKLPDVVSVPKSQCSYALCFDQADAKKLVEKLSLLKAAAVAP